MKKVVFFISLITLSNFIFSQTAFYDAQYLSTLSKQSLEEIESIADPGNDLYKDEKGEKTVMLPYISLSNHEKAVLKDYKKFIDKPFDATISNLDLAALKSCIDKYNKFLETVHNVDDPLKVNNFLPGTTALLSLIPGIVGGNFSFSTEDQTKIIDGLTKYYAEEFRKAQLITYMQTFKKTIGKIGELQVLFPQTYAKLKSADPSKFPELGDEYKTIFNEDLINIIDNLVNHIDNHTAASTEPYDSTLKWLNVANNTKIKGNKYYECFTISAAIGSKLINNYHPVDLIHFLDNNYYDPALLTKNPVKEADYVKLIFHGLNLIQRNLLDSTKKKDNQFSNIWLNLQDLKKLDTPQEWLFFAGLLYQQDRAFFDKYIFQATGQNITADSKKELLSLQKKLNTIHSILVEVQDFRSNLKEENIKENFAGYMGLILKAIDTTRNTYFKGQISNAAFNKYLQIAKHTLNIYDNARKKDYNNTIYYIGEILNEFLGKNDDYLNVLRTVEEYATFMTDVLNTKNSDEVKEIIKKHAAQPATFILKREFQRTLSITGQPGYFISLEKLDGKEEKAKFVSGITLPIGFEFSWKIKYGRENSGSLSVFAQLIDLGAVLNFRVGDSTSTLPDKIEFKQIFSPGGSINYGFKNSPLTLGLGYQYTPQLRKVEKEGTEFFPNGHRVFLRVAWDIPLINIAKSKKR